MTDKKPTAEIKPCMERHGEESVGNHGVTMHCRQGFLEVNGKREQCQIGTRKVKLA